MRFWDANCFVGAPPTPTLRSFMTTGDLLREMDDLQIERACVCHFDAQQLPGDGNAALMDLIAGHDRLMPCWIVNPQFLWRKGETAELLKMLAGEGVRMVRFQPGPARRYALYPWAAKELLGGLSDAGIVTYVDMVIEDRLSHAAVDAVQWEALRQTATTFPRLKLIVFGKKLVIQKAMLFGLMDCCANVMMDISAFQSWQATEAVTRRFGAHRQVFGGFMPYFDPGQFIVQIANARIDPADREKIAWKNLAEMLDMESAQ